MVAALREERLISATEPYVHDVPHSFRSGMRIEPLISLQWFCDMEKLAAPAIAAVEEGRLRFHPSDPHTQVYLELAGEHPAVVRLTPAVVGAPDPGVVPRRGAVRRNRAA